MPGMATDAELKKLGTLNGKQAEVFYLQLMTAPSQGRHPHGRGLRAKCTVGVEKKLAQGMVDAQQSEIQPDGGHAEGAGAKPVAVDGAARGLSADGARSAAPGSTPDPDPGSRGRSGAPPHGPLGYNR